MRKRQKQFFVLFLVTRGKGKNNSEKETIGCNDKQHSHCLLSTTNKVQLDNQTQTIDHS